MLTLLLFYLGAGGGLVALALPLLAGKIKPNPLYGFRLSPAVDDPKLWYPVNRYAAKRLVVTAVWFMLAALGLYAVPGLALDAYALGCLAVLVVVFGIGFWQSLRYMRRLAGRPG